MLKERRRKESKSPELKLTGTDHKKYLDEELEAVRRILAREGVDREVSQSEINAEVFRAQEDRVEEMLRKAHELVIPGEDAA